MTGAKTRSMKTASRSKVSTAGSVVSGCTSSGKSCCCIASSTSKHFSMSFTPWCELVVAPAGYHFTACTQSLALATAISVAGVCSVRYNVIKGSKLASLGTAARMRSRYCLASSVETIGGTKFGMMIARANRRTVCGTTSRISSPSRTCK